MALADRVKETSTTTGTGSFTLDGAVTGFKTFVEVGGDTEPFTYCIENGAEWEVGIGMIQGGTLTRAGAYASSNANNIVSFGAGTKTVFMTLSAHDIEQMREDIAAASGGGSGVDLTTAQTVGGVKTFTDTVNVEAGLAASGSETNIDLSINAKGTGKVLIPNAVSIGTTSWSTSTIGAANAQLNIGGASATVNVTAGAVTLDAHVVATKTYASTEYDAGDSGTAKTLTFNDGQNQKLTLTGNCTLTLNNAKNGFTTKLRLVQDATGGRTVTWPSGASHLLIKWAGGVEPTLSTAPNAEDIVTLYRCTGGWYGMAGVGFA